MHYCTYVYGPRNKDELTQTLAEYNENGDDHFKRVLMTNIPEFTLENTMFDVIKRFRAVESWGPSPIVLVDRAKDYLENRDLRNMDAYVISYDLDSKEATAQMVTSKAFWDWWVIGGRWPMEFHAPQRTHNVVGMTEISAMVDMTGVSTEGYYSSVYCKDIDHKKFKQEHLEKALKVWEYANENMPDMVPQWKMIEELNLPDDTAYYQFNCKAYDAWRDEVRRLADLQPKPEWSDEWCRTPVCGPFYLEDVIGLTKRQLIRYAILRTYVPAFGVFDFGPDIPKKVVDLSFLATTNPKETKELVKYIRKHLTPDTVVTAVDIHN